MTPDGRLRINVKLGTFVKVQEKLKLFVIIFHSKSISRDNEQRLRIYCKDFFIKCKILSMNT